MLLFLTTVLLAATALSPRAFADDINVHPAACVAPFLNQAFPMRWTEHFVMNPADNRTTWLVCPMTFDNDPVLLLPTGATNFTLSVTVKGAIMSGADPQIPVCYFTVTDRDNLLQNPYIMGTSRIYLTATNVTTSGQLWTATANANYTDILAAVTTSNVNRWSMAAFCQMPPGYSISQVAVVR